MDTIIHSLGRGLEAAAGEVSEHMVDSLIVHGGGEDCYKKLKRFVEAG